jgi:sugar phosphate isomerase/epimerase
VKLGFVTVPFADWTLEQIARWAKENGFEALEVARWPAASSDARRYAVITHIDVDSIAERADEIRSLLGGLGIEISGLGYYPNHLHPDPGHRASVNDHTGKVIRAAARLGVPVVNTFVGRDRAVYEFGDRIFHDHAKDLQIRGDGLYDHGVMSLGMGWQVPRLPGLGEVRWDRLLAALYAVCYDGSIVIEHEVRRFEGSGELVIRGFHLAREVLRQCVV